MQVEVGQEPVHLDSRRRSERVRVDARAGHDHHPQAVHAPARLVVGRHHPPQQVVADTGPADADDADDLVVARSPAAAAAPRGPAGSGRSPITYPAKSKCCSVHSRIPRQPRTERQVDDVAGVADEHRAVAQVRVARDVLDHLGVVVGGQEGLAVAAVGHRHPADEVGHPDERRPLELGVLVQEVVEVPRLVAEPEVEVLPLDQVVEDHEVVDQHLVHAADGLERVQVVLPGLGLEVPRLAGQQPRRRVDDLAALLQEVRHRRLRQPLDLQVRPLLAHRVGDRQVAADVAEPDRRAEVQRARSAAPRPRRRSRRRGRRPVDPVDEALDRPVDEHRVPRHRQMPGTLEDQALGARQPRHVLEPPRPADNGPRSRGSPARAR